LQGRRQGGRRSVTLAHHGHLSVQQTRVTCYAWAYEAGIRTSDAKAVNPHRQEFPRLRAAGLTRAEARARVGADSRSATGWDKGITIINRGRVYPDGRVVR
jgi:IS30 family transposase